MFTYRDAAAANEFETGEIILSGDLRIAQGTVDLSLFNAVTLTVQGPAHLDLRSPENIILHQGRLHAHVPEPAKGFTITTSAGRLVDLGTDFGISALAENLVEAAVFSGQVEVFAGKDQFILNANEGVRLQPGKAPEKRTLSQGHFPLPHKHLGNLLVDGDFESDTTPLTTSPRKLAAGAVMSPGSCPPRMILPPNPAPVCFDSLTPSTTWRIRIWKPPTWPVNNGR